LKRIRARKESVFILLESRASQMKSSSVLREGPHRKKGHLSNLHSISTKLDYLFSILTVRPKKRGSLTILSIFSFSTWKFSESRRDFDGFLAFNIRQT
jgi:hypothetical protein